MKTVLREYRHAARALLRGRGVTFVVLLVSGLGMGAGMVISSLASALTIRPLPVGAAMVAFTEDVSGPCPAVILE